MLTSPSARPSGNDLDYFNNNKSGALVASTSADVYVTTRRAWREQQAAEFAPTLTLKATEPSLTLSSPTRPPVAETKKRKEPDHLSVPVRKAKKSRSPPLIQVTKPQPSPQPKIKKRGASSIPSSRQSSRPRTVASSPEPESSTSRSRSVSAFPALETPILRPCWIDDDGTPGPGFISNEDVVRQLMERDKNYYKGFFKNLDDPNDKTFEPENSPIMELEYPNNHACERFLLLAPRDKDHYHPVYCLEATLYVIIEYYLTPAQQSLFGTIPTAILADLTRDTIFIPSPLSTPTKSSDYSSGPPSSSSSPLSSLSSSPVPAPPQKATWLRQMQRAIHRQDGPTFLKTMTIINSLLRSFKYPPLPVDPFEDSPGNMLKESVASWTHIPNEVRERIYEETYQRCVGPSAMRLEKSYKVWSNEVYGELLPNLLQDIFSVTGLGPDSLFMDLGSGVGNVVLQASMTTGCTSYGIEIGKMPAELARAQLEQVKKRCRMWGFSMGEVELEEGDMLKSERLSELMKKADVVLINNKVFAQTLNEAVRASFLDLKEGAIVVSLASFWDKKDITERNVNDMSAIFQVTARPYRSGSVSWGNGGGCYYLHRVDREGYRKIQERIENSSSSSRAGRPRR